MAELPSSPFVGSPRRRAATAASIEAAYRAHAKEFLRVATAIAGSREGGRDAVQEALTRAFARRATFRGSGTMEAWLWRAVVNAARNVRARSPLVAEDPQADTPGRDAVDEPREAVRAAVAAQQFDLLSFLHTSDRNSARFSVSRSRAYHGAAPLALTCPGAKTGAFVCNVTGLMAPGNRSYELGMRTDKVPSLTRQGMLASLSRAQANGADPAEVARVRDDLSRVGDDFIRALAVLSRIETVGGVGESTGPSGTERVPPRGVPAWTACRELTLTPFRC